MCGGDQTETQEAKELSSKTRFYPSHFPSLTRYFTPSVPSTLSPLQRKASFLSNLPGDKKFVMKRLRMESSKIQVEVCHLGTRYGRKRFSRVLGAAL